MRIIRQPRQLPHSPPSPPITTTSMHRHMHIIATHLHRRLHTQMVLQLRNPNGEEGRKSNSVRTVSRSTMASRRRRSLASRDSRKTRRPRLRLRHHGRSKRLTTSLQHMMHLRRIVSRPSPRWSATSPCPRHRPACRCPRDPSRPLPPTSDTATA